MQQRHLPKAVFWFLSAVALPSASLAEDNWPQFRGPSSSGVAAEANPPDRWSTTENVSWVKEIPGRGWSSPIVWGKTVFVTSAISTSGTYKERLYVVRDNGILAVFDAKTGERLYRARVGGGGHTFSSSPWAYQGKVFFLSEDGDTFVAKPGDAYEEVGKNSLGQMSLASPAVSGDSLYIRTLSKLYRISNNQTDGVSQ
jgi:outer membrane protein assembly factor BamB